MAAALALARAGWEVELCEEAAAPGEVGAGLQMSPNAAKVLRWLGVLDRVMERAFQPQAAELRDGQTGAVIYSAALGQAAEARWGAPYLQVHRADLLAALTEAARDAGAHIRGNSRVAGFVIRPEGPAVKLAGGEDLTGDLLIGADGIRSVLRSQINGPEEPEFTGKIAWRGTLPAERLPEGLVEPKATVWAGPGRHLVTYLLRGGKQVNFVAAEERAEWTAEGWSAPGDPDLLRRAFAGWHKSVTTLLEHVDSTFIWGLFGRPEQVRWVQGPVVLIGDAAHPMVPFLAQGAAMGLEDVAVLLRELQTGLDLEEVLLAYEERRWQRVTKVQHRSQSNGELLHRKPGLMRSGHLGLISAVSRIAPGFAAGQLDWLYGYDATAGLH
jgi:salicylate hydroxylase